MSSQDDQGEAVLIAVLEHFDIILMLLASFFTILQTGTLGAGHLIFIMIGQTTNEWVCYSKSHPDCLHYYHI